MSENEENNNINSSNKKIVPVQRPRIGTPINQTKTGGSTGGRDAAPSVSSTSAGLRSAQAEKDSGSGESRNSTLGSSSPPMRKPMIGKPIASKTSRSTSAPRAQIRLAHTNPVSTQPILAGKRLESKLDLSRRNFMKGLIVAGGLITFFSFLPVADGYLRGSVEGPSSGIKQTILNSTNENPLKTSDIPVNNWATFVYPRTGNSNIDSDTFRQFVVVHLPKGFTAASNLSVKDPLTGDLFVGLSRVCIHLWCLWSYVPTDMRAECPCHGSQYVPGSGSYPNFPVASYKPVGYAVAGPASLQTPPNNILPVVTLQAADDGTLSATGIVGQIGCGQLC